MVPDLDLLNQQLANTDPNWITITLRGIGEMHGDPTTPVPNPTTQLDQPQPASRPTSSASPAPTSTSPLAAGDLQTWQAMDKAALDLAQAVAGAPADIQYLYDGGWRSQPFPLDRPFPEWHRGLGTTYHESGTLWMGDDPGHLGDRPRWAASTTSRTPMPATSPCSRRSARSTRSSPGSRWPSASPSRFP